MKSVTVDHARAAAILNSAWKESSSRKSALNTHMESVIRSVLEGPSVGFRYVLVTGILAKLANKASNARALQKGSSLDGAYDARSLCHKVIVPFEHERGDMWGFSNEPFLSKALRHKEHDKNNPQLRDKLGAGRTQEVLDWANSAKEKEVFEALVFIMQLGRLKLKSTPKITAGLGRNLDIVKCFTHEFLSGSADGGSRLVSIVGAFMKDFNSEATVNIYNPNAADQYSKTAGDIEISLNGRVISAFECKDRVFNENDIEDSIEKAVKAGVREYIFVSGFHSKKINYDFTKVSAKKGIDLYSINLPDLIDEWIVALNVQKRAEFGMLVIKILLSFPRGDVAKVAEEIWNSCSKKFG